MEKLGHLLAEIEALPFNAKQSCVERLDNQLQDVLLFLNNMQLKACGELLELKNCSWVLHERYHMDTEEQLKFTFHHTKHRILKSAGALLELNLKKQSRAIHELVSH